MLMHGGTASTYALLMLALQQEVMYSSYCCRGKFLGLHRQKGTSQAQLVWSAGKGSDPDDHATDDVDGVPEITLGEFA